MGNTQVLPNGNVVVGWGEVPFVSEYSPAGKLLFDAALPSPDMSYRAYVQPWVGKPLYPPSGAARAKGSGTTVLRQLERSHPGELLEGARGHRAAAPPRLWPPTSAPALRRRSRYRAARGGSRCRPLTQRGASWGPPGPSG